MGHRRIGRYSTGGSRSAVHGGASGRIQGLLSVNESVDYDDAQGNTVDFGDPQIQVTCGTVIILKPCPVPVDVTIEGCEDEIEIDAVEVLPEELDVSGSPDRLCDQRNFNVRFIANYIDAGFTCCTLDD